MKHAMCDLSSLMIFSPNTFMTDQPAGMYYKSIAQFQLKQINQCAGYAVLFSTFSSVDHYEELPSVTLRDNFSGNAIVVNNVDFSLAAGKRTTLVVPIEQKFGFFGDEKNFNYSGFTIEIIHSLTNLFQSAVLIGLGQANTSYLNGDNNVVRFDNDMWKNAEEVS